MEFQSFGKIPRLSRDCIITEKIDGLNAQICIHEDGQILTGSRTRWIRPDNDNYGFSRWVYDHAEELQKLGPGRHFGEWYGSGIQRKYGLSEKRFALFNTSIWNRANIPSCCSVVPELFRGEFHSSNISKALEILQEQGSQAVPGYMNPEGIIIYHIASGHYYKKTLKDDEKPKGN